MSSPALIVPLTVGLTRCALTLVIWSIGPSCSFMGKQTVRLPRNYEQGRTVYSTNFQRQRGEFISGRFDSLPQHSRLKAHMYFEVYTYIYTSAACCHIFTCQPVSFKCTIGAIAVRRTVPPFLIGWSNSNLRGG